MADKMKEECDLAEHAIASTGENDRTENTQNIKSMLTYASKELQEIMEKLFQILYYTTSQYDAKQNIEENIFEDIANIKEMMQTLLTVTYSKETMSIDIVILATAYLFMSVIHKTLYLHKSDKEQLQLGYDCTMQCLNLLQTAKDDKRNIMIYMRTVYELGYIYKLQENQQLYKITLRKVMHIYLAYTMEEKNYPTPKKIINISFDDDGENVDPRSRLTKLYADTMFSLGEFYYTQKEYINDRKVLIYKHKALNEYVNIIESLTQDEYIECAIKLVELASLFAHYGRFTESRHHLAAASFILQKYDKMYINTDQGKSFDLHAPDYEFFHRGMAIVARGWAKYGIHLLELSHRKLLYNEEYEQPYRGENLESISSSDSEDEECETFTFHKIEKDLEAFTALITDDYLLNYNDVKTAFDSILKWLDELKIYITPEKDVTEYVIVILDISRAYKCLTYFTKDHHNWMKLHKYRLEILEDTIKLLDPRIHTKFCKRIWYELATIYFALTEKYFECTRSNNMVITKETGNQINCFINNIIQNLESFSLYELDDNGWIHLLKNL